MDLVMFTFLLIYCVGKRLKFIVICFLCNLITEVINIVTCRVVRMTIMTGSSSDDWIYWHFGYKFS
jgi:hypothetical protein